MKTCRPIRWACRLLPLFSLFILLAACAPQAAPAVESIAAPEMSQQAQRADTPTLPAPVPDPSAALSLFDADPRQAALIQLILTDLAGNEKQHLLVAQVQPNPTGSRSKLSLAVENILRAWVFQDGDLRDCPPAFYAQSYTQEGSGAWKYAYLAFSLVEVSPDVSTATVRIDRIPGLAGGRGELLDLTREGEQWSVKSRRSAWIQ